jgi:TolA-binding protein
MMGYSQAVLLSSLLILCGCGSGDLTSKIDLSTAREGQLEDKVGLLEDRIQQLQIEISQLKFTIVQMQTQIQHK